MSLIVLIFVVLSFILSASAGLGGSLILIPVMSLLLGSKAGIAVSAVLLGGNNIFKAVAYRNTIPLKESIAVIFFTMLGAGVGSHIMIFLPEEALTVAVVVSIFISFCFEKYNYLKIRKKIAPFFAFGAGLTSGVTGTSGPLKGIALRSLDLSRFYFVGAASIVSLTGDLVKVFVFFQASLYVEESWSILMMSLILMPFSVYMGRFINEKIGEKAYQILFWVVMAGYSCRLLF